MAQSVKNLPAGKTKKESACNAGDLSSFPGLRRSPEVENGNPTPIFLPGEFHGQRGLVGYSPWVHKELDMIEQLSTAQLFRGMCLSIQMQHPTYNLRESRPVLPKTHLSALG